MRRLHLRRYVWLAPMIALALGYVTGHKQVQARKATLTVPGSSLMLEYPVDWGQAALPAALSAFGLQRALVLAPHGDPGGGGLLAAVTAEGPLPKVVLGRLAGRPEGQAISLVSAPAFRYEHVSVTGSKLGLTVYSVPTGVDRFTLAMCFAPQGASSTRSACEEIVQDSQVPNETSSPPVELKPRASYATALNSVLAALAKVRDRARARMSLARSDAELSSQAKGLAGAFATAQASLTTLGPPPVAARAAAELERAMLNAKLAYEALAGDAVSGQGSAFALARRNIGQVEAAVRDALASFALLGYRVT